jgi:hypothetical protein
MQEPTGDVRSMTKTAIVIDLTYIILSATHLPIGFVVVTRISGQLARREVGSLAIAHCRSVEFSTSQLWSGSYM